MQTPKCKNYTGYRPCRPYRRCEGISDDCSPFHSLWLLADISAPGALLRDRGILSEIEQHHQDTLVVAVTGSSAVGQYDAHPCVDLVFPFSFETVSILNVMQFDRVIAPKGDAIARNLLDHLTEVPGKRVVLENSRLYKVVRRPTPLPSGKNRILIINLDALGDVLMTTALLPAIKREWPGSTIEWVTDPYATQILKHNPLIDRVIPYNEETVAELPGTSYDLLLSVDKGRRSCALAELTPAAEKRGFGLNALGHITWFNRDAEYAYRLGLDDYEKFRVNTKTGQQLLAESMGLTWKRDPYTLILTAEEERFISEYRERIGISGDRIAIGFNTGCSDIYPNKKLPIDQHVQLIKKIDDTIGQAVVLLVGGKQETGRNAEIAARCRNAGVRCPVIETPTTEGLRRGILYIGACDVLVSGDTSALHIGIGLGKFIVSWFGVSCWTEIDLYDNGVKFYHEDLDCSPCWKRRCTNPNPLTSLPECISRIDLDGMATAVARFAEYRQTRKR